MSEKVDLSNEKERNKYWTNYANKNLEGKTIRSVSYMTKEESEDMGWYKRPIIIEFTDGTLVFPSRDDEGNNGGAMFGQTKDGEDLTFPVIS